MMPAMPNVRGAAQELMRSEARAGQPPQPGPGTPAGPASGPAGGSVGEHLAAAFKLMVEHGSMEGGDELFEDDKMQVLQFISALKRLQLAGAKTPPGPDGSQAVAGGPAAFAQEVPTTARPYQPGT